MHAPTIANLRGHAAVQQALEEAWIDSAPADPRHRHEEGGWIFMDTVTGLLTIRRATAGRRAYVNFNSPPIVAGSVVVATFHTHPNPMSEGWNPGPSRADEESAWLLGVPCFIRAEDGVHATGPDARRGGLTGSEGFPD
jgi:hypothetical protein